MRRLGLLVTAVALVAGPTAAVAAPAVTSPARAATTSASAPAAPAAARKAPRLAVKVAGKSPRKVKRGAWVTLKVKVTNRGSARTRKKVKVSVSGRGVTFKKRAFTVKRLAAGASKRLTVRAKLTKATKKKVTIKAVSGGQKARARVTLAPKKAPKKGDARAGSYSGGTAKSPVTFTVTKDGYVKDFRVTLNTRCGGYPNPFTYHWAWYNHPKAKIGAHGKVDSREDGGTYISELTMAFAGAKVKSGSFTYYGPNRCYASIDFTAARR